MKIVTAALCVALTGTLASAQDKKVDFKKDVEPIFKANCIQCHGLNPKKPKKKAAAKLRLDDKTGAMSGGRSGAAIVPGNGKGSLLVKLLAGPVPRPEGTGGKDDEKEIDAMPMPKKGETWKPLSAKDVGVLTRWIDEGANWP
ncbi:MAG: hypothetical protein HY078_11620 [Elusimicrobia bacterium]|nr:hypothetical protein [Elusimicrobiota bacterium]